MTTLITSVHYKNCAEKNAVFEKEKRKAQLLAFDIASVKL